MLSTSLYAQDVVFTASARQQVSIGERFILSFKVNADGKNFKGPNLKDFSVLGGPNPSHSSSFQFVNGSMKKQIEVSYNFILVAKKQGVFEIPSASITVDRKVYKTDPVKVVVKAASSTMSDTDIKGEKDNANQSKNHPLAFLKASADKKSIHIGEQVVVTYKLYFRANISDYNLKKAPGYPGFWFEDMTEQLQPGNNSTEEIKGVQYTVVDLRKDLLVPQKSGKIKTSPMEFEIVARVKAKKGGSGDPFFDDFFSDSFFGNYKNIQRTLVTEPIELDVKALPMDGKPSDFGGAVGKFTVSSSVDLQELKVNDAITYKVMIKGNGNLKLIQAPKLNLPPDFEVYDPKVIENYNTSISRGVSGTKTFEYLIIPRTPGTFKIPAVIFSYFDLNSKKYIQQQTPSYDIEVLKGDGAQATVLYSGNGQEEIRYMGKDIRYIKTNSLELKPKDYFFISNWRFALLMFGSLLLFALTIWLVLWNSKRQGNRADVRNRKASKVAVQKLKKAKDYLTNNAQNDFYEEISVALWGYISDKYNISRSVLSIESVADHLEKGNVNAEIISRFVEILKECEFARFAPGDPSENMKQAYDKAADIIMKIEKELR
ncbi:MAG: protein BatD [Bacteroidales bacterium]|nr:protein BatD [Bacteroidales bacterium]